MSPAAGGGAACSGGSAVACGGRGGSGCGAGGEPVIYSSLSELNLSENPLGLAGAKAVAKLLDPTVHPGQFLVKLNLSKCGLGEAGGLAIAAALRAGNLELRVLLLAHNSLGNKTAAAFGDLLESSHTLKELDLSWNQIKAEGARALAKGLAANATLSKLCLAWNGLEEGACALGEMLAANMGLKHLDLSHCRVGAEACLMLGEGLKGNVMLEVLLLSGNDRIGEDGARHLMAALAANRSLTFLGLNGSNMTAAVHDQAGSASKFNPASPDGSYSLDLAVAADRVVAVQLVELDRASERELLRGISLEGKVIPSARKANWPAMLPSRGLLSCTFSSAGTRRAMGVMEPSKLATLLKQLRLPSMADRERLELVSMFAPFALFTCRQIASVVRAFLIGPERVGAAALLFTRAVDAAGDLVSLTGAMSGYDLLGWREALGWYSGYRWNVPTGHYELDLAQPLHAAIAARLRDESNDSPEGPTWMNLIYDCAITCMKRPEGHGPPDDWKAGIPTRGSLSLDYVSTHPPGTRPQHTTWGLPPLSQGASSSAGSRSRPVSSTGAAPAAGPAAARASASGAAAAAAGRPSVNGAAAAAAAGRVSGNGGGSAAAAGGGGGEVVLEAASDAQLEALMRDQMGLRAPTTAAALPAAGSSDGSSAAAAAGCSSPGLSGVAAADAAIVALRQAVAAGLVLRSAQVRQLVEAFTSSPHRVEVAVLCWPVTLDRADNYWTVLYCLQGIEQSSLIQRLGPARLFNPAHASCHWVLDLAHPAHEEVAKKLVALASSPGSGKEDKGGDEATLQNWWNLRLRGVRKQVNENGTNMWGMLTAETFQPILEFDFLGPDSWAGLGRSEAEVAALPVPDRLELRAKQAARLEAVRMRQLYPYSCDGSGYQRQAWGTYDALMAPQLAKTPWVAAWDRLVRVLLRLELRAGSIDRHSSALQQAFEAAATSQQTCRTALQAPAVEGSSAAAAEVGGVVAAAGGSSSSSSSNSRAGSASGSAGGSSKGQGGSIAPQADADTSSSSSNSAACPADSAAAAGGGRQESEGEGQEQLCITAQELEVLLKSWGYNKAEVAHYLRQMEAVLQADWNIKQAAAAAAAAAAAVQGESGGSSSQGGASGAPSLQPNSSSSSNGDSSTPSTRSSTPTTAAATAAAGSKGRGGKGGFAAAAAAVKAGVKPASGLSPPKGSSGGAAAANGRGGVQKGGAAAAAGADAGAAAGAGGVGRPSGDGQASFAVQLEACLPRGLTFPEFVALIMAEPPKALRLRDVVTCATLLGGGSGGKGGLLAGLKGRQKPGAAASAAAAVAAAAAEPSVQGSVEADAGQADHVE